jgi:hypothetical protein
MRSIRWCALATLASTFVLNHAARAAEPTSAAACASVQDFLATDCPLTWHGITLYGAYDVGLGWVSHGLP